RLSGRAKGTKTSSGFRTRTRRVYAPGRREAIAKRAPPRPPREVRLRAARESERGESRSRAARCRRTEAADGWSASATQLRLQIRPPRPPARSAGRVERRERLRRLPSVRRATRYAPTQTRAPARSVSSGKQNGMWCAWWRERRDVQRETIGQP